MCLLACFPMKEQQSLLLNGFSVPLLPKCSDSRLKSVGLAISGRLWTMAVTHLRTNPYLHEWIQLEKTRDLTK